MHEYKLSHTETLLHKASLVTHECNNTLRKHAAGKDVLEGPDSSVGVFFLQI